MYEELVNKLRYCNLYGEEPLHWVGIICEAAETIEKLEAKNKELESKIHDSFTEHLLNQISRKEKQIDGLKTEKSKLEKELELVKAEREVLLKEKAEREKECDFCNAEYVVMSGSRMSSELIHKGCVAKFCPNCGKRLVSEE